jgi:hypothetical protein
LARPCHLLTALTALTAISELTLAAPVQQVESFALDMAVWPMRGPLGHRA